MVEQLSRRQVVWCEDASDQTRLDKIMIYVQNSGNSADRVEMSRVELKACSHRAMRSNTTVWFCNVKAAKGLTLFCCPQPPVYQRTSHRVDSTRRSRRIFRQRRSALIRRRCLRNDATVAGRHRAATGSLPVRYELYAAIHLGRLDLPVQMHCRLDSASGRPRGGHPWLVWRIASADTVR
jgi:hypothetical protein